MMMKNLLFQLIFLLSVLPYQIVAIENNNQRETLVPETYKVLKIKRIKNIFVIYALKVNDNTKFEIVSIKGKTDNCTKIRVGNEYRLVLYPDFDENDFSRFTVTHVEISGILIPLEREYNRNLYFTSNLIGLCYIEPGK